MVGWEKEGGEGRVNKDSLNELNLIFPDGRFYEIQSEHGLVTSFVARFDPGHHAPCLAEGMLPGHLPLGFSGAILC